MSSIERKDHERFEVTDSETGAKTMRCKIDADEMVKNGRGRYAITGELPATARPMDSRPVLYPGNTGERTFVTAKEAQSALHERLADLDRRRDEAMAAHG